MFVQDLILLSLVALMQTIFNISIDNSTAHFAHEPFAGKQWRCVRYINDRGYKFYDVTVDVLFVERYVTTV